MRGFRNFTIFCVSIFFQANAIACVNFTGNYQCARQVYFWQDSPKVKSLNLKVEQSETQMQWQLGSTFADWELNGMENTTNKIGTLEKHKVQCDDSRDRMKAVESFSDLSRMGSTRAVEFSQIAESKISLKIETQIFFGNEMFDESTERWQCTRLESKEVLSQK